MARGTTKDFLQGHRFFVRCTSEAGLDLLQPGIADPDPRGGLAGGQLRGEAGHALDIRAQVAGGADHARVVIRIDPERSGAALGDQGKRGGRGRGHDEGGRQGAGQVGQQRRRPEEESGEERRTASGERGPDKAQEAAGVHRVERSSGVSASGGGGNAVVGLAMD